MEKAEPSVLLEKNEDGEKLAKLFSNYNDLFSIFILLFQAWKESSVAVESLRFSWKPQPSNIFLTGNAT